MRAVKEVQEQMALSRGGRGAGSPGAAAAGKVLGWPARTRQFLHDVRQELRTVTWPNRQDVQATTVVVLATAFFFGFYLGLALDWPLTRLMRWLMAVGRGLIGS